MADQPFLFFVRPTAVARAKRFGGGGKYAVPTPAQQRQRLQARFEQIAAGLRDVQQGVAGLELEQVIVLETLTDAVEDVAKAASRIPGLEWLAERDLEDVAPESGFRDEDSPNTSIPRRLYALFTNQQAMDSLLGLWRQWQANPTQRAKRGFGPFKNLFSRLRDIRRWGPQDRVADTGIVDQWEEDIAVKGQQGTCQFEVEFWYRLEETNRRRITDQVAAALNEAGGQFLDQAVIPEIRYHAALAELPANTVRETLQRIADQTYTRLLNCEGVMFFRPQSLPRFGIVPIERTDFDLRQRLADSQRPDGIPILGLLDGLPLENHEALQGRMIVDDPDNFAALYQANQQQHGTAMASLLIHGDLNGNGSALSTPIYVRPVLHFEGLANQEIAPPRRLFVDVIHRAVKRIFEKDGETPAAAPSVRIINVSIGDTKQPFVRDMSALARLLDWLAWKYKVLFVVSSGNCNANISITTTAANWTGLSAADLTGEVLRAMRADQFKRRLLSPAESINCLTAGATHGDDCQRFVLGNRVNLFDAAGLPSPSGTVASGFRRATKPEILLPGGRTMYTPPANQGPTPAEFTVSTSTSAPGHLTACPGTRPLELGRVSYSCGSSNAAALASRYAGISASLLADYQLPPDCNPLDDAALAVLLKALLVHAATWGEAERTLDAAFANEITDWRELRRIKQQFLGYGEMQSGRCLSATDQRATLLGWSTIGEDEGQVFSFPLPPSLAAGTEWRRLSVTLAWLTPLNNKHKNYRRAHLFLRIPNEEIGAPEIAGIDEQSGQRGTVQHRVFEGQRAKAFVDGASLTIQVSCRADAGDIDEVVPFALVTSLEVAQISQIAVYQEVSARIRPLVEIAAE